MNDVELETLARIVAILRRSYKIATPALLVDEARIDKALALFSEYLPGVQLYYAVKANPAPSLLQYFAHRGLSFDVASAGEIAAVNNIGVSGASMLLSAPIKTPKSLEALFDSRISFCAVDTIAELDRILAYRERHQHSHLPKIFVRLRVESKQVEVDLNTKFGCSIADALSLVEHGAKLNCEFGGICFHVGTQSTSADNYFLGIESAMLVAKECMRRYGVEMPVINIGGGFCDAEAAERAGVSLPGLYASIGHACTRAIANGFRIVAEPGRCLVNAAGTLVTSVIGTNVRSDKLWAYLDDGIYGCYSNKLYENPKYKFYGISPSIRAFQRSDSEKNWTIAGPTCDSLDVVAENVALPGTLQAGDLLATPNVGAYSLASASSFNGFAPPQCLAYRTVSNRGEIAEVIVRDGSPLSADKAAAA